MITAVLVMNLVSLTQLPTLIYLFNQVPASSPRGKLASLLLMMLSQRLSEVSSYRILYSSYPDDHASDRPNGIFDVSYALLRHKFVFKQFISAFFAVGDVIFFMSALEFLYILSLSTQNIPSPLQRYL